METKVNIPRLSVLGTNSDAGKTTIAIGLMAHWRRAGYQAQPFKLSYDFLDSYYHSAASGRCSMNFHSWLIEPTRFSQAFQFVANGSDLAICEGGGGMILQEHSSLPQEQLKAIYDLKLPGILIIDPSRWSELQLHLRNDIPIEAVILNRLTPQTDSRSILKSITDQLHPKEIWVVPNDPLIGSIPNRYFGFVPYYNDRQLSDWIDSISEQLAKYIDMTKLLSLAQSAPPLPADPLPILHSPKRVRIAVAQDLAFHHPEAPNLRLLEAFGAELVPFSPLSTSELPADIDGLYLSGRFTEFFASDLSRNTSLLVSIKTAIQDGLITFAEGGGFMILTEAIVDLAGVSHPMIGLIPGVTKMVYPRIFRSSTRLTCTQPTALTRSAETLGGFEDHFGVWECPSTTTRHHAFRAFRKYSTDVRDEGWTVHNTVATTLQTNFLSNLNLVRRWTN